MQLNNSKSFSKCWNAFNQNQNPTISSSGRHALCAFVVCAPTEMYDCGNCEAINSASNGRLHFGEKMYFLTNYIGQIMYHAKNMVQQQLKRM